jgi:hypothetical protein
VPAWNRSLNQLWAREAAPAFPIRNLSSRQIGFECLRQTYSSNETPRISIKLEELGVPHKMHCVLLGDEQLTPNSPS